MAIASIGLAAMFGTACSPLMLDVGVLSSDALEGRPNDTPASVTAQDYLIARLTEFGAVGLDTTKTGAAAFRQAFPAGTNVIGMIRGSVLPNEYVVVGAHYDHLGSQCAHTRPGDLICNGATDNAAGVAAVLQVGRVIAHSGVPKRSVVLALWDREEDGLLGSAYYVQHPIVPLDHTVGYVNFDIAGANLLPSLRNTSFALGAETGGAQLKSIVSNAVAQGTLQTRQLSYIFGQGRSDYVNFIAGGIPTVFFSDSTGPCYHTVEDEFGIVDFAKLQQQAAIAARVTRSLINGPRITFSGNNPPATYADAVGLLAVVNGALPDRGRFTPEQQTQLLQFRSDLNRIVGDGNAAFGDDDAGVVLGGAAAAVGILSSGSCDGFLAPSSRRYK